METFKPLSAILDGISTQLYNTFGDKYTIYTEEVKQGLKTPCFFIKLLNPTNTKEVGVTYFRQNQYVLHFMPEDTNEPRQEIHTILDDLYLAMEHIFVVGNLVRGTGLRGEPHDNILLFYVNYNVFVRKVKDPITMGTLELLQFTKGE